MSRVISFEGRTIEVPDDATDAEISQILDPKAPVAASAPQIDKSVLLNADPDVAAANNLGPSIVEAVGNAPSSAGNLISSTLTPLLHPIDTAKNLGHTALGYAEKLIPGKQADEPYADAVNGYFGKRYGDPTAIGHTLTTDPLGAMADLSVPLTLGGAATERAPGVLGEVGSAAAAAGRAANPFAAVGKAAAPVVNLTGKTASNVIGGLGTHTGPLPIEAAFAAGKNGGAAGDAFLDNLRGNVPLEGVVSDARTALDNMRAQRNARYVDNVGRLGIPGGDISAGAPTADSGATGLVGAGSENPPVQALDISPIAKAFADTNDINSFKGVDLSPGTAATRQKLGDLLSFWQEQPPADFHTVAGVDALKKAVGNIRDSSQYGTPDRVIANRVYNAARDAIVSQVPDYAAAMDDYAKSSNLLDDIEGTLSLNRGANIDTPLRKLQSALRDNVSTTYGRRADLVDTLAENGAPNLVPALAGQALKPWTPRGMGPAQAGAEAAAAVFSGHPYALAALPLTSPRMVGEGAYALGQGASALGALPNGALANGLLVGNQAGAIANLFKKLGYGQ